jgi:uncharacterized membrane protein YdjX (TVP38/TMEM64 family)
VWFRLEHGLAVPALVVLGALAAASGRYVLGAATMRLRDRVSAKQRDNLEAARHVLHDSPGKSRAAIGLFLLSPVPSAQLFEAAGLIGARLLPLTLAFGAGRLVTYAIYVGGASAAEDTDLGRLVKDNLTSPLGVGLQVLLLLALYALTKIDWHRFVK